MPIEIYLKGDRTYVKETAANGDVIFIKSTTKARTLELTKRGVLILPDGDEDALNNQEIILADLVDKFGATTPEELLNAIGDNNFFKKGGGWVSGDISLLDVLDSNSTTAGLTANKGRVLNEKILAIYEYGNELDPNEIFLQGLT